MGDDDAAPPTIGPVVRPDPTLTTPRLILRRWREADLEPFACLNAEDPHRRHVLYRLSRADWPG